LVAIALQKRGPVQPVANVTQPPVVTPEANPVSSQQTAPITTQSRPAPATAPLSASVATGGTTNTSALTGNPAPSANPASTDSDTNVTTAAADVLPPKPASPKLQGIFYRPTRPSAVINGKNVFIGSRVGEFKVRSITQENVTIVSATQTNVLSLEQ
jgi:hypothetical protein